MVQEVWRPVTGYEGCYEVSNCGRVRSLSRVINLFDGRTRRINEKILSPKQDSCKYLSVSLSIRGVSKMHFIHRLVAGAFLENPENLPEVNHISGVKGDSSVENLEWCTHQQNVRHAYDIGLTTNIGGGHYLAVGVIDKELNREFETVNDWCIARGIAYSTGKNLMNGIRRSRIIDMAKITRVPKTRTNE